MQFINLHMDDYSERKRSLYLTCYLLSQSLILPCEINWEKRRGSNQIHTPLDALTIASLSVFIKKSTKGVIIKIGNKSVHINFFKVLFHHGSYCTFHSAIEWMVCFQKTFGDSWIPFLEPLKANFSTTHRCLSRWPLSASSLPSISFSACPTQVIHMSYILNS